MGEIPNNEYTVIRDYSPHYTNYSLQIVKYLGEKFEYEITNHSFGWFKESTTKRFNYTPGVYILIVSRRIEDTKRGHARNRILMKARTCNKTIHDMFETLRTNISTRKLTINFNL